jgi:transcription factor C subunit 6
MSESRAAQTRQKEGHLKSKKGKSKADAEKAEYDREGSGSWPPEVGIHRVAWNTSNGMSKCQLLASATASGLCRIDSLWGRFHRERVPYGSIQKIRGEQEVDVDDELAD